jgi:tyrosinase
MARPTRRSVLMGGAATAAATLAGEDGWQRPARAAVLVRYDASSTQGKNMLNIYAGAVGKMMDPAVTKPGSPLSWLFQWYTHGVNQPWQQPTSLSFKEPEINRVYADPADPNRALAETMWDTCTHYGQPQMYFLPWHRMYLYFFEEIIRAVSGQNQFTLPYWDYTNPARHALPPEFTMANDPVFKPLFRAQRKTGVNDGAPIDGNRRNTFLNLNDMMLTSYLQTAGSPGGFCPNLDRNLHGNVHTNVGTRPPASDLGMTFVPTAANDPIFWLHHCNIDRVWASWNKAGGLNPDDATFKSQPFTFADRAGKAVQRKVGDALDTQQLDYAYDNYLNRPAGSPPFPAPAAAAALSFALHAELPPSSGAVSLGSQPVTVALAPQAMPGSITGAAANFSAQIAAALQTRQVYVVLNNIQARQEPGVVYDVYLDVPAGERPTLDDPGYVGTLNFFSAHGEHAGHSDASVAFLATDVLRTLRQQGRIASQPTVTLVPEGTLVPAAEPQIGSISLISQSR